MCQDRVKQARSYLMSIFDEAIEQEFLLKDPSRKLKVPKNLRPKDKQVLTWEQIWGALRHLGRRDRLILTLDLTEALRPSELFALRWRSFDDRETLTITETVYKGKIRPYGKTDGSLTDVHLPPELAEELRLWKSENPKAGPDSFIFPNSRGRVSGHEELSQSCTYAFGQEVGSAEGELSNPAPHHGNPSTEHGLGEGHSGTLEACEGRYHCQRVHAGVAGEREDDGRIGLRDDQERRDF